MRAINLDGTKVLNVIIVEDLSFPVAQGTLIEDTSTQETGFAQAGGWYIGGKFYPPRPTNEEQAELRRKAYELEADPIFFMSQRGEATQEEWQAKITEIKERYPYYFDDEGNLIEAQ
jgi:spore cortex formation protein SpoVR/YcgB (stage V sporulation)